MPRRSPRSHSQASLFDVDLDVQHDDQDLLQFKDDQDDSIDTQNSGDLLITNDHGEEIWEVPTWAPTRYLSHDYFRYIGKFPPQIPRDFIAEYSIEGDMILDPMCGGGTVLTEARLANRLCAGRDVNPVSVLVSRVVSRAVNPELLSSEVAVFLKQLHERLLDTSPLFSPDSTPQGRRSNMVLPDMHGHEKYFDEGTLRDLGIFFDLHKKIRLEEIRDFLLVALFSVLRKISHANVKKMNLELDFEKKNRKSLFEALSQKVQRMVETNRELAVKFSSGNPDIRQSSADDTGFDSEVVDLVIVHPPYMTNTAFSEVTQLQLAVLGISHKNIWKTELRARGSFMHEPNGVSKYIVGWNRILKEMYRVVKPGGYCAVVVGDGQVDYTRIPVGAITGELARDIGFDVIKRARHRLNHNTGRTLSHKMRDQHILILKK